MKIDAAPIERHTLANGLRVVLQRDDSLPLVAVNLWYHVGSKDERPGRTGLAHLFEHMLFQGSANVAANDHFRLVQQVGGVANASTWYDRTNYFETLPAHHLDLALWLESDRMGYLLPALSSEKLENQREVVMNERRQRVDNQPYGRAFERLHELVYPEGHPYRPPVIGYMDDIAAASLDDLEEFFRTHYAPGNAVLTLCGDFDPSGALASIERYFGPIPAGAAAAHETAPALPRHDEETRDVLEDRVELPRVYFAWACPGLEDDSWYAADLLSTLLAGGKSSPLYSDLVLERRLAQSVSAFIMPTQIAATFAVVATAKPDADLDELEAAIEAHVTGAAEGIAPRELERTRNRVQTSYFDELQSLNRRADLLSQLTTFFDDPERIGSEVERYLALDAAALSGFAERYLTTARRAALRVVPGTTAA